MGSNHLIMASARTQLTLSRWLALLLSVMVWPVLVILFHGMLPWAMSRMARRFGWSERHPGLWNWLGLIFVALGSMVVLWFWFVHVRKVLTHEKIEVKSTPDYLLTDGPYRYSRNPMYLAALVIWFGWAVFYGSWLVLAGLSFFWLILKFLVIPREERGLEARHKEIYRQYLQRVPRWF
jgi:protein-S-isoprenylcysteine O-methyltransferase Ste14